MGAQISSLILLFSILLDAHYFLSVYVIILIIILYLFIFNFILFNLFLD